MTAALIGIAGESPDLRHDIARALAEWRSGSAAEDWETEMYLDAADAVLPLIHDTQADLLRAVAEQHDRTTPAEFADWVAARLAEEKTR